MPVVVPLRRRAARSRAWLTLAILAVSAALAGPARSDTNFGHLHPAAAAPLNVAYTAPHHLAPRWGRAPVRETGWCGLQGCPFVSQSTAFRTLLSTGPAVADPAIGDVAGPEFTAGPAEAGLDAAWQALAGRLRDGGLLPEAFAEPLAEAAGPEDIAVALPAEGGPAEGGPAGQLAWPVPVPVLAAVRDAAGAAPADAPRLLREAAGTGDRMLRDLQETRDAGAVIEVSDAAGLAAALAAAVGGETIVLAAGDYGTLFLRDHHVAVTIVGDRDSPASFGGLDLGQVSGVKFDGVVFDYRYEGGEGGGVQARPFFMKETNGIGFANSLFDGDDAYGTGTVNDGYSAGRGLKVLDSDNLVFVGNEMRGFYKGLSIGGSDNVVVIGNEFHDMRSDFMTLGHIRDMLIEDNHFHDRRRAPGTEDHADMIQTITRDSEYPIERLTIRGNLFDIGDGEETQTLYLANRGVSNGAGYELYHRDFVIENNVIINEHKHGITVGEIDGLVLRNNSVLHAGRYGDRPVSVPTINIVEGSMNVTVSHNVSGGIAGYIGQADWSLTENFEVQNTNVMAPDHYSAHFLAPTGDLGGHPEKLQLRPDSPIAAAGAGAAALRFDATPETLTPLILTLDGDEAGSFTFDSALTAAPEGLVGAAGQYVWSFSDGFEATGTAVGRSFSEPGIYAVTLKVTYGDTIAVTDTTVKVADPDLVVLEDGVLMADSYGTPVELAAGLPQAADGSFDIGALGGTVIEVPGETLMPIYEDGFAVTLRLAADAVADPSGEIMRMKGAFTIDVDGGDIVFEVNGAGSKAVVATAGGRLNDGFWHDVTLSYDAATGIIRAAIDGGAAAEGRLEDPMNFVDTRDLTFGGSFGRMAFDGRIADLAIRAGSPAVAVVSGQDISAPGSGTEGSGTEWHGALTEASLGALVSGETYAAAGIATLSAGVGDAEVAVVSDDGDARSLRGGSGDDVLRAGATDTVMTGGVGTDMFVFDLRQDAGPQHNVITDYGNDGPERISILTAAPGTFDGLAGTGSIAVSADGAAADFHGLADLAAGIASGALVVAGEGTAGVLLSIAARPGMVVELAGTSPADLAAAPPQPSDPFAEAVAAGALFVEGTDGGDVLRAGGAAPTVVAGYGGNDKLWGGAADDVLAGGAGSDRFMFDLRNADAGHDVIADLAFDGAERVSILTSVPGTFDDGAMPGNVLGVGGGGASADLDSLDDIAEALASGALVVAGEGEWGVMLQVAGHDGSVLELAGITAADLDIAPQAAPVNDALAAALAAGALFVEGTDGGEVLRAANVDSAVAGHGGNDKIWGGPGNDVLSSGAGGDKFMFDLRDAPAGHDAIVDLDFAAGDRLQVLTKVAGLFSAMQPSNGSAWVGHADSVVHIFSLEGLQEAARVGALTLAEQDTGGLLVSVTGFEDSSLELIQPLPDDLVV